MSPSEKTDGGLDGEEKPGSGYDFAARLLHHFALGSDMVVEMSFAMDRMFQKKATEEIGDERHVFIAGAARAGTTALLRLFYETGAFASLCYRDMPFPLAPHFWSRISGGQERKGELKARAHDDGMLVDFSSPEALEEVFWRIFSGTEYIRPDRLLPMEAGDETLRDFKNYVYGLLHLRRSSRYLSKNNNNILRLGSIRKAFPNALILAPYREPTNQALSLHRQHMRFIDIHKKDPFAKSYMKWLVHHEFGSDHRFFDVQEAPFRYCPEEPAYWLDQWTRLYRFLLDKSKERGLGILFVEYETLCDNSEALWKALARHAGLHLDFPQGFALKKAKPYGGIETEKDTLEQAYAIFAELKHQFEIRTFI